MIMLQELEFPFEFSMESPILSTIECEPLLFQCWESRQVVSNHWGGHTQTKTITINIPLNSTWVLNLLFQYFFHIYRIVKVPENWGVPLSKAERDSMWVTMAKVYRTKERTHLRTIFQQDYSLLYILLGMV